MGWCCTVRNVLERNRTQIRWRCRWNWNKKIQKFNFCRKVPAESQYVHEQEFSLYAQSMVVTEAKLNSTPTLPQRTPWMKSVPTTRTIPYQHTPKGHKNTLQLWTKNYFLFNSQNLLNHSSSHSIDTKTGSWRLKRRRQEKEFIIDMTEQGMDYAHHLLLKYCVSKMWGHLWFVGS